MYYTMSVLVVAHNKSCIVVVFCIYGLRRIEMY
jgi:hypothetical protein